METEIDIAKMEEDIMRLVGTLENRLGEITAGETYRNWERMKCSIFLRGDGKDEKRKKE